MIERHVPRLRRWEANWLIYSVLRGGFVLDKVIFGRILMSLVNASAILTCDCLRSSARGGTIQQTKNYRTSLENRIEGKTIYIDL